MVDRRSMAPFRVLTSHSEAPGTRRYSEDWGEIGGAVSGWSGRGSSGLVATWAGKASVVVAGSSVFGGIQSGCFGAGVGCGVGIGAGVGEGTTGSGAGTERCPARCATPEPRRRPQRTSSQVGACLVLDVGVGVTVGVTSSVGEIGPIGLSRLAPGPRTTSL